MAKFNYGDILDKNEIRTIQTLLSNPDVIKPNFRFWEQHFNLSTANFVSRGTDGSASFSVDMVERNPDAMADFVSPLSETNKIDKGDKRSVTGTLPYMSKGEARNAWEKMQDDKIILANNQLSPLFRQWVESTQTLIDAHHARLSNMAAQVLSQWEISTVTKADGKGMGLPFKSNIYKEYAKTFTAGAKIWSDPDCKIIDQIQKLIEEYRDKTGFDGAIKLMMTEDQIRNVMLPNKQVREQVILFRNMMGQLVVADAAIVLEQLIEYSNSTFSVIPPIEVAKEFQKSQNLIGFTKVRGWNPNNIAICPIGKSGIIVHTNILDVEAVISTPSPDSIVTAMYLDNGLIGLVNRAVGKGGIATYFTDTYSSAIPVIDNFLYHVVVDITKAD